MTKTNKHHDRARVDDDLHGRDELRAEQQVQHGERNHHQDQRERAVNRLARQNQQHRARTASSAHTKNK